MNNICFRKSLKFIPVGIFFFSSVLVLNAKADFDDFSDANKVTIGVSKSNTVSNSNTKAKKLTNENIKQNNSLPYKRPQKEMTKDEAIQQVTNITGNEKEAKQIVNIIGAQNYTNFTDSIGGAKNIPSFIQNQFGGSLQNFQSFVNQVGKDNVAQVIRTVKPNNVETFVNSIGGLNNLGKFTQQIGGIGNLPSFTSQFSTGQFSNFTDMQSVISQVGLNNLNSFVNGIGGFSNISNLLGHIDGGASGLGSFLSGVQGVNGLSNLVSGLGSYQDLVNLTNVTGGFSNLSNLISGAGSISNLTNLTNGIGIGNVAGLLNQLGNGNLTLGASSLSNVLGEFSNFGGVNSFVSMFNNLNGLGGLSSLSNFGTLNMFINGDFSNLLSSVGNISSLNSLFSGLGSIGNFQSFFNGLNGFGGLNNFSGMITGLFGGYGSNFAQNFLGNLNLSNILGSFNSLPNIQSIMSQFNMGGNFDFMSWIQQYLGMFGIAFGQITGNCQNSSDGTCTCGSKSVVNTLLGVLGGLGSGYNNNGDGSFSQCSGESCSIGGGSGGGQNPTYLGTNFGDNTFNTGGCSGRNCPFKSLNKTTTSKIDTSIFPKKIVYDPSLKKKNLINNVKSDKDIIINDKDIRPQLNNVPSNLDSSNEERKKTYDEWLKIENQWVGEGKKLPFVLGSAGNNDSTQYRDEEEKIATTGDFKMCNNELEQEEVDIDKLTAPGGPAVPIESCADGTGVYLHKATSTHANGYFEHKAYNTFVGDPADFTDDPEGPLSGCYEIHKVKDEFRNELKPVGRCRMTFTVGGAPSPSTLQQLRDLYDQADSLGDTDEARAILSTIANAVGSPQNYVPKQFQEHFPSLFGCILGCRTWTIIADKIEYYYPTYLVTMSRDPLYSRYLNQSKAEEMKTKYQSAVQEEINKQKVSSQTSERILKNTNRRKGQVTGNTNNETNEGDRAIQPTEELPETAFLSKKNQGYLRIFDIRKAEEAYDNSTWRSSFRVIPHISSNKEYWGTDFQDKQIKFSTENRKENLHFFIDKPKNSILDRKDIDHLEEPWKTVMRDGEYGVGGSKQYGTLFKADPELHGKGTLSNQKFQTHNTLVKLKNAYGVGNISALNNLSFKMNSDYILQTLVRSHNMFITDKTSLIPDFETEDQAKPVFAEGQNFSGGSCPTSNSKKEDGQLVPENQYKNYANPISRVGMKFYNTKVNARQGERQTFNAKYDLFHAPMKDKDEDDNMPKLFNEFFNRDIQNIIDNEQGNQAKIDNVENVDGKKCYKIFQMMNNNLDFNLVNTVSNKFDNVSTTANKGETSFIIYNLFSGTIAFPGMSCNTWYYGANMSPKPSGGGCYEMNGGSRAQPKLRIDEFRLF